ncbi:MAG: CBS domain-containing protein [Pseudomonadota bacterium]
MTVAKVLSTKPVQGVHTIEPEVTIADAVTELATRKIGALVVSSDGKIPVGILSERDIVREMAREGGAILTRKVSDLMTKDVKTCICEDRAADILQVMTDGRFRHMPVMRDGGLVGVISLGDVVKARLSEVKVERDAMEAMIAGHG